MILPTRASKETDEDSMFNEMQLVLKNNFQPINMSGYDFTTELLRTVQIRVWLSIKNAVISLNCLKMAWNGNEII